MTKRRVFRRVQPAQQSRREERGDRLAFWWQRPPEEMASRVNHIRWDIDFLNGGELAARIYFEFCKTELPAWIKARPGSRPLLWWMFDRESPRLGLRPGLRYPQKLYDREHAMSAELFLRDPDPENDPWVPESRVLARLGLLTPPERRVLRPQVIKPTLTIIRGNES